MLATRPDLPFGRGTFFPSRDAQTRFEDCACRHCDSSQHGLPHLVNNASELYWEHVHETSGSRSVCTRYGRGHSVKEETLPEGRPAREPLAEGREHLTVSGLFRSDKYWWSKDNHLPLKLSDKMAWPMLRAYADARRGLDPEFSRDLHEALDNEGAPRIF